MFQSRLSRFLDRLRSLRDRILSVWNCRKFNWIFYQFWLFFLSAEDFSLHGLRILFMALGDQGFFIATYFWVLLQLIAVDRSPDAAVKKFDFFLWIFNCLRFLSQYCPLLKIYAHFSPIFSRVTIFPSFVCFTNMKNC